MTVALGLALALPTLAAAPARAAEIGPQQLSERLQRAEEAFGFQDYDAVIRELKPLADDDLERVEAKQTRVKVLERLGVAHWFIGEREKARTYFANLLTREDEAHQLDPLFYPPELVTAFEARKDDLRRLGLIGKKPVGPVDPDRGPSQVLIRETTRNNTPVLAYLLPGGVGQFANGHDVLGGALLGLQILGAGGTVAAYFALEGLKNERGVADPADSVKKDLFQGLWIGSMVVLAGAFTYSVVDGLIRRPDPITRTERLETLPAEPVVPEPAPRPTLQLTPGPTGLGLGLGGTF